MNKTTNLSDLSSEELIIQKQKLKGVMIGLGIVMLGACSYLIYTAIATNKPAFIAIAIGSSLTLLPGLIRLGQLNTELKKRNNP